MAISRLTNWAAGQVLTASALNAEVNNIIDNALALISPLTGNLDFNNNQSTNFRVENRTTNPATGNAGRLWFRTDLNAYVADTGGAVAYIPTPTGLAKGSLIVAGGATGYGVLAVSSQNGLGVVSDSSQTLGVKWGTVGDPLQAQVFA